MTCKSLTTRISVVLLLLVVFSGLFSGSIAAKELGYNPGTVSFFCIAKEILRETSSDFLRNDIIESVYISYPTLRLRSGSYDLLVEIEEAGQRPIELIDCPYVLRIRIDEFVVWELTTFQKVTDSRIYVPRLLGSTLDKVNSDLEITDGWVEGCFEVLFDNDVIFEKKLMFGI